MRCPGKEDGIRPISNHGSWSVHRLPNKEITVLFRSLPVTTLKCNIDTMPCPVIGSHH